ncbi:lytic transglycosylase domain-containing protein [Celeribacter neptunius]|uniref:Transglycosylase SLT domain-containing protein n=1 Tax=Celeribacter neptunius TaxID=588602 RepID=A0A1I3TP84_9RHOB|nr:lytic transglycosylase domain-containing protein [Celeribacter neptunius]SFJ72420.1 Transglycosylase SLT domain-containing protein [Celeribacter neptunius]
MRVLALALCLSFSLGPAGGLRAEEPADPRPWPEVRTKRIGVPDGGAGGLIDIQIRSAQKTVSVPPKDASDADPLAEAVSVDLLDWYWEAVPHDLAGAAPSRFAAALAALDLEQGKSIPRPTFQNLTDIANHYGTAILLNSVGTQVSPALALAVIAVESSGEATAESKAGAQGLMQLIPATAERFGVDATEPEQNIKGGIAYLDWLLKQFNGDLALALAGYNAGENAVRSNDGPPPYAETRAYVPKVLAAWQVARGLCLTPPELYYDGCVFATNAVRAEK